MAALTVAADQRRRTTLMALEDVLTSKLMALDEHSADFSQLLLMTRTLREQIDWDSLRARTRESAFAKAFFTLAEELSIAPPADASASTSVTSRSCSRRRPRAAAARADCRRRRA